MIQYIETFIKTLKKKAVSTVLLQFNYFHLTSDTIFSILHCTEWYKYLNKINFSYLKINKKKFQIKINKQTNNLKQNTHTQFI